MLEPEKTVKHKMLEIILTIPLENMISKTQKGFKVPSFLRLEKR
jgi:hypothetical protein